MVSWQLLWRGAVLALVVLLAACATSTPPPSAPAPVVVKPAPPGKVESPPARVPPQAPPRPATPSASAAWQPLLAKAQQATQRGDYEQALALLERAQRIDPDSAEVYLCMAQTQRASGNAAQARAMAERGLLYCSTVALCNALRDFAR
jgi:Tfp pilus assembly protein PilF